MFGQLRNRMEKMDAYKGPVMMLASALLFAVMGVFVKLASAALPAEEIAFVRFLFGVVVCLGLAANGSISLASEKKMLLLVRGVFGGLAVLLFFLAIGRGSLTNATVLNNTYPIFATIIAGICLHERPGGVGLCALGLAVVGVILLTNPDFGHLRVADLYGLTSGILAGVAIVVIRELRKTESAWSVFFWLSLFGMAFSGALALQRIVIPSLAGGIYMFLAAFFGMVAQVLMTSAYRFCTTSVGSVLSISTVLFSAVFGLLFLGDRLTVGEGVGAIIVVVGSVMLTMTMGGGGNPVLAVSAEAAGGKREKIN